MSSWNFLGESQDQHKFLSISTIFHLYINKILSLEKQKCVARSMKYCPKIDGIGSPLKLQHTMGHLEKND
jgi:hypothetical protein